LDGKEKLAKWARKNKETHLKEGKDVRKGTCGPDESRNYLERKQVGLKDSRKKCVRKETGRPESEQEGVRRETGSLNESRKTWKGLR
jgi:hypothetical protein